MAIKFKDNTPQVKKMLLRNIFNALEAVGFFVSGDAKRRVPVDRGALRESISHESNTDEKIVRIGASEKYAVFVEKGTGIYAVDGNGRKTPWLYFYDGYKGDQGVRLTYGQKPQPFLTPAGEENISTIVNMVATQLKKGFEK